MSARLALSTDFFDKFARLPQAQQRKVSALFSKFMDNPRHPSLNYEQIYEAGDPNMRSLRVDIDYRAIVLKPARGQVHQMLHVAKHDDAYKWAKRHKTAVNPETQSIQVYPVEARQVPEQPPPTVLRQQVSGLFSRLKDRQLMRLGVPRDQIGLVRAMSVQDDLDRSRRDLPLEAYEGLFFYAEGLSFEEIINDRATPPVNQSGEGDVDKALEHPESRARFVVVHNHKQLDAMLNAPLEKWRVFLHPNQRAAVERDWNGPVRLLGAAGTGKTVVAMHRVKWLLENRLQNGKILLMTYNRNLAADIRQNLSLLCTPEQMQSIEVINVDAWVKRFLQRHGWQHRIAYSRLDKEWNQSLKLYQGSRRFPLRFFDDEWEQVIQANGVATVERYKRVSRRGRGVRLRRKDRIELWKVFEDYRLRLASHQLKEIGDACRDAMDILKANPNSLEYRFVIVDEAQDLDSHKLRLIRSLVPQGKNDLFITGDGHQRIYGRKAVVLGRCGINIRGRSRKLRLNYRTTEETRAWASRLLSGKKVDDLDGGSDSNFGIHSVTSGPAPELHQFATFEEQAAHIASRLQQREKEGEGVSGTCVACRFSEDRDNLRQRLETAGIVTKVIGQESDDPSIPGVRFATMHRVKGLEFDRMILASVNDGLVPPKRGRADDLQERCLLYVAASRAKVSLEVLCFGKGSHLVSWPR